jgi:hypothetical protein
MNTPEGEYVWKTLGLSPVEGSFSTFTKQSFQQTLLLPKKSILRE